MQGNLNGVIRNSFYLRNTRGDTSRVPLSESFALFDYVENENGHLELREKEKEKKKD